jgi:DNA-binding NarL/FixJ family response regulator
MADKNKPINIYKKPPVGIAPGGRPYRAAIVDDSKMMRQILKQILLSVKFDVIEEIDNGSAAVEKVKNKELNPDYMFIDVEMPLLNGIDVVRKIKPIIPDCKIYMVTSHSEKEQVEELIKMGINGYIKKPFDRETVIRKLSGHDITP